MPRINQYYLSSWAPLNPLSKSQPICYVWISHSINRVLTSLFISPLNSGRQTFFCPLLHFLKDNLERNSKRERNKAKWQLLKQNSKKLRCKGMVFMHLEILSCPLQRWTEGWETALVGQAPAVQSWDLRATPSTRDAKWQPWWHDSAIIVMGEKTGRSLGLLCRWHK